MPIDAPQNPKYAEFFCGGGMVRAALHKRWDCVLANDIDAMKCDVYAKNWGNDALVHGDIATLPDDTLRQQIDLYWASSPCQDFSLAGKGRGLSGVRSGVFTDWADKITTAIKAGFAPRIIAFENVVGLVSRNGGADMNTILATFVGLGYKVGALEIDARRFLPQSRPRLFVICVRNNIDLSGLTVPKPSHVFHGKRLQKFLGSASRSVRSDWVWWKLEDAPAADQALDTVLERRSSMPWFSDADTERLISLMSPPSLERLRIARQSGRTVVGTIYKRGRPDAQGDVRQRAELRTDGLAGCLRTPAGGASRQILIFIKGKQTKARLVSSREVARLMGLPDSYSMPDTYNNAYRVAGDGVAVPVVGYLDEMLFAPILQRRSLEAVA